MTKYLKKLGKYDDNSVYNYQKNEINRLKTIIEKYKKFENNSNSINEKSEDESFIIKNNKDENQKNLKSGKLAFYNSNIILVSKQSINENGNEEQNNFLNINFDEIEEKIDKEENEEEEYEENEENEEKEEKENKEKIEEIKWGKYSEIEEEEESSEEI